MPGSENIVSSRCARLLLTGQFGVQENHLTTEVFFCGDSPNDEPMFSFFPLSCGVANIEPYLSLMTILPAYVTTAGHGTGFAEAAEIILGLGKTEDLTRVQGKRI